MTAEQYKAYTEACNAFGEALERIFKTEAPMIERQEIKGIWEGEPAYTFKSNCKVEIEKDWEILAFRETKKGRAPGSIASIKDAVVITTWTQQQIFGVLQGRCEIYSVKRISDNTIWTLGEWTRDGKIALFYIFQDQMRCSCTYSGYTTLKSLVKCEPLFITADGVEVFEEGTTVYRITEGGWVERTRGIPEVGQCWYSSEKAAFEAHEEWLSHWTELTFQEIEEESSRGVQVPYKALFKYLKDKIAKR